MGAASELLGLLDADDRHEIALGDVRAKQIEAANELFHEKVKAIRLLANRAEEGGITEIRSLADLVPLLFAHTTYKSYPEAWFAEGKWDRMGKWLDTVSTNRVEGVDCSGVSDVDDWIERLADKGHFMACSSGTTGKISMINASAHDREMVRRITARSFQWATGLAPQKDRLIFTLNPRGNNYRNIDTSGALMDAFAAPDGDCRFTAQITIGEVSRMVALRRRIADGTAQPEEISAFEATSAEREKLLDDAVAQAAEGLAAHRDRKVLIIGQFPLNYRVSEAIRAMGLDAKDFHPDNALTVGGGLKGTVLPDNYREYVFGTLNIDPGHVYHMYAMQEVNTHMPRCHTGRYHVPPWLIFLPLDRNGEALIEPQQGEFECRAGFFDLAIDGRWGGVITGDRVYVDYGDCACGRPGPTINPDIVRYKDLPGGDYITCAGTIDAYVRGVA